ncbi:MAG TPA: nuclear transport factor 2 family protein [Longimicrobiales bacterium]|nr:nuclear transport factor 2 family protein [Longimicrobiales bacterium]
MPYRRLAAIVAAAALVACAEPPADEAPAQDAEAAAPSDQEAIAAVAEYWETHYNMQHADMVASTYGDEAWVAPADGNVFEGREGIQGWLAGDMEAMAPTIDITPVETVVVGDLAMSIGSYSVSAAPEGADPVSFSGTYINSMARVDGEWVITGTVTNYDSPRPEGWAWNPPMEGEVPPDSAIFPEMITAYEAAWNAGDGAALAAMYTENARAAWTDAPLVSGRAAIEAAAMARTTTGSTLDLHEVGGEDLGDGWTGVGGWYSVTGPDGEVMRQGIWMNLVRTGEDGTPRIHWTVSNGRPGAL